MSFSKPPIEDMLAQARIELSELRASVEYDEEFMEGVLSSLEPLEQVIEELLRDPQHGRETYAGQDLPFMERVRRLDRTLLPFKQLFIDINIAHRERSASTTNPGTH